MAKLMPEVPTYEMWKAYENALRDYLAPMPKAERVQRFPGRLPAKLKMELRYNAMRDKAPNLQYERIIGVAVRQTNGLVISLPSPKRHGDVFQRMVELGCKTPVLGEQGFVTNLGRFVDRTEGMTLAKASGQYGMGPRPSPPDLPELYSEDLW